MIFRTNEQIISNMIQSKQFSMEQVHCWTELGNGVFWGISPVQSLRHLATRDPSAEGPDTELHCKPPAC